MPPRRVTRAQAEAFLRRLDGKEGAERARLLEEHRAYVDGTRDRDADFGDDVAATYQKKGALVGYYNLLARAPRLKGKAPVAALYAEELAADAASADEDGSDSGDEDYVETGKDQGNDDADFDMAPAAEITTPKKAAKKKRPAKATGTTKAKGKRKPQHRRAQELTNLRGQQVHTSLLMTKPTGKEIMRFSYDISRHDDDIYDGGALDSDYDDSDTGSAEWYEDMDNLGDVVDAEIPSESDTETSDELSLDASPTGDSPSSIPAVGAASTTNRRGGQRPPRSKEEAERWKDIIDNWRIVEGSDLSNLAHDTEALRKMRKDGWESGMYFARIHQSFKTMDTFLGYMMVATALPIQFLSTGENKKTLEEIVANERRVHRKIKAHEILQCIGLLLARTDKGWKIGTLLWKEEQGK
ncbi:hypothetical protein PInf_008905 [Phytophthora infestans]|nr:hypothetical protein PInf_008905 [Phytophthora infestans]